MTLINKARAGKVSEEVKKVAKDEARDTRFILAGLTSGRIVIPKNIKRKLSKPCGIGEGLKTKINTNVGTSKDSSSIAKEVEKTKVSICLGTDAVMDLSTGPGIKETRRRILAASIVAVGTVPMYEIVINGVKKYGSVKNIPVEFMFDILEEQAADGVDFFTIHSGVTRRAVKMLARNGRVLDIVSRGGALMAEWMFGNNKENPFYEKFDKVLDIVKKYDITLSLGDGLRPGSVADATDGPQISELITLGELQKISLREGVQVMIEGPGHVPINQIEANVLLEKSVCNGAPFYVLGPLVTDVAPGYDHITAAIGGAIAASKGADFLCYVTPAEHLRLPTLDDVKEGVIATKIAAHAADIAKGIPGAIDWDIAISKARKARDWKKQFKLAIDREKPRRYRSASKPGAKDVCTMCGEYCSIKISEKCLESLTPTRLNRSK
ncbi:MAG: phosphomethylpyrimidine synthase ThiC [Candidatus Omnitrophota bacterium]|nr:phosphomethylpyrimidine synthase ThiC [Candidatus Omnitrophota bacterium]